MKRTRTRFAPSPTGYMHVGNLRTALYAFLTAKHNNGDFVLRIEDTDQARLVDGAVEIIYDTLRETHLLWDEGPDIGGSVGPYIQSQRMGIFKEYAEDLIAMGHAYYCFCTGERLRVMREEHAESNGGAGFYDGYCMNLSREEIKENLKSGIPYVIRQKMPKSGVTAFDDLVYGHIEVENNQLEDQILIKSDGMPTYNFANVVDDHLMGITHVIRGSEYLSSTPKYNLLYRSFRWDVPIYIHCPPVMKDAHNKLSKRNGDASYQDLIAQGYLGDAIINYLLLLGWSPKDEREIFKIEEMIEIWNESNINKSPAIFDSLKLRAINAVYIRNMSQKEFFELAQPWIDSAVKSKIDRELLCANLHPRCEIFSDIPARIDFFDALPEFNAEIYSNKKQKTTPTSSIEALKALNSVLYNLETWNKDAIFESLNQLAMTLGQKNGWLMYPLGIALSGKTGTPGGGTDLAVIMGKAKTIERVKIAIDNLSNFLGERA